MNKLAPIETLNLPDWLASGLTALNTDFGSRVVCPAQNAVWQETSLPGVLLRLLEYVPGVKPRLVAQLKFEHDHTPATLDKHPDLEILIQQGQLLSDSEAYDAHWYFRVPQPHHADKLELTFQQPLTIAKDETTTLYLAVGQMKDSDHAKRRIDTRNEENWLPGPIEGTDVLPLHGHGSGNVMLIRWNKTATFKTRIDPRGEELLVLSGAVYDAQGLYPQNSWIRNPIAAWQPWGARAGTVVYYKNGHFADSES